MITPMSASLAEGQSTNRPPLFNGSHYPYWKTRMTIYVQAIDFQLWRVITRGPHIPIKKVDSIDIPKNEEEWDEHDMKMAEINVKAMNLLYYTLDPTEFNRISTCISVKEIWDKL